MTTDTATPSNEIDSLNKSLTNYNDAHNSTGWRLWIRIILFIAVLAAIAYTMYIVYNYAAALDQGINEAQQKGQEYCLAHYSSTQCGSFNPNREVFIDMTFGGILSIIAAIIAVGVIFAGIKFPTYLSSNSSEINRAADILMKLSKDQYVKLANKFPEFKLDQCGSRDSLREELSKHSASDIRNLLVKSKTLPANVQQANTSSSSRYENAWESLHHQQLLPLQATSTSVPASSAPSLMEPLLLSTPNSTASFSATSTRPQP